MHDSRRDFLRNASAFSALAVGASATATAADCGGVPDYDAATLYESGDRTVHDGVLWEAVYATRANAPSEGNTYWSKVGPCDGSGGSNAAPTAAVSASVTTVTTGETVDFDASGSTDADGSIAAYSWDFTGDGTADASGQTTSHSYATTGDYTAVLTVTDDDGATATDSVRITVEPSNEAPTASFTTGMSTPAPGEDVTFDASGSSDPDSSIASYAWNFGDGATANGQSVTHSYDSAGDYTVTLSVTDDDDASATASTMVSVSSGNAVPDASFTVSPSTPEPGESATLDAAESADPDGSITSYEWAFGDGTTATGESVTHTYEQTGEYTVTLTVTDDAGATDTNETTVSVQTAPEGPSDEFKVIGYYPGWKATPEYDYYPEDIPFDKVTHVQYAFLGVDAENAVPTIMSDQDRENLEQFRELKDGAASDTKITLSIGGWADSTGFSEIAMNEGSRQSFADRCVEILREYNLDGIDIDWEHPGSSQGKCQCGSNEDYVNHVDLLQALRDTLDTAGQEDGKHYELSVANGGSDWNAGGLRHGDVGEVCDFASIMAYDFTGSWMDVVGQNAPLYGDGHPTENSQYGETYNAQYYVEYTVDELYAGDHGETGYWPGQWEYPPAEPADYSELVLGLPFYGRGFNGTEMYGSYTGLPQGTWHDQLEDGADPTGAFDFGDLEENFEGVDGWTKSRHDPGAVPYIVNEDEETIVSYDDPQSIEEKVQFAKERGMQGVMFWELSQDWNETLLDTINETA